MCKTLFKVRASRSGGAVTPWGLRADTEAAGSRQSARIGWLVQSAPPGKHSPAVQASSTNFQHLTLTELFFK